MAETYAQREEPIALRRPEDDPAVARPDDWESTLRRWEVAINTNDGDGLRARWESGRTLRAMRQGKLQPRGVLANLTSALGVSRSELTARMKFAELYPTDAEVNNAVGK